MLGSNLDGQLGVGSFSTGVTTPVENGTEQLKDAATGVSAGDKFACAVGAGIVQCWGNNDYGQLGNGTAKASAASAPVFGIGGTPASVSAGGTSACALTEAGAVYCWGDNSAGQLGTGSPDSQSTTALPVQG